MYPSGMFAAMWMIVSSHSKPLIYEIYFAAIIDRMANQYTQELYNLFQNRFAIESSDMLTSTWLEKNTSLKGRPFSFNRYPFQRELVDDDHRNSATIKPSQVGVSEIYQRAALAFLKRHRNTKGIYAYPDDDMRKKNVQTRVMPMVESTDIFNKHTASTKPVRSIQLLQIEQSFLYMTGSKEGDATSTDADFVFLDEYDLHDMDIAGLFSSRLLNSEHKIKRYFSTPTFTQYGIHQLYENSDQMEYLIKCDSCNHWQFPLFEEKFLHLPGLPTGLESLTEIDQSMIEHFKIDLEASYVCCERCRRPLDLGRESNRAWVAKYPSRQYARGRRVNPFSVSTRPPRDVILELVEIKNKGQSIRRFKNTILGEPEDSSTARISESSIRACITGMAQVPAINKFVPTWVGIDMGHTCTITVGQGYSVEAMQDVLIENCPLGRVVDRAKELCKTYNVIGGLCDRHPESNTADSIREATGGKILPCEYRGDKEINIVKDPLGKVLYIQANRTTLLDKVATAVRGQSISFSGYGTLENDIVVHLRNMVRDESPEQPAVWRKLDPMDHIFHSVGFQLTAVVYAALDMELNSLPQTFIGIAGADFAGYNDSKLIGIHARPSSSSNKVSPTWQPIPSLIG